MSTIEGVPLHPHICEDCHEAKECFTAMQQIGNGPVVEFYRCLECEARLMASYYAHMEKVNEGRDT